MNQKGFSSTLAIAIATLAALIVAVGLGYWFISNQSSVISDLPAGAFGESVSLDSDIKMDGTDFYAVFIGDGQIYFAQLGTDLEEQFIELKNVYYLQQVQGEAEGQSGTQLVKRGGEMYGPDGNMIVNRDHLVSLERLRSDSDIVKAIYGETQTQ